MEEEKFISKKYSEKKFEKWVDKNCDSGGLLAVWAEDSSDLVFIIATYGPTHYATYNYKTKEISTTPSRMENF